jgi:hypothetical protein
MIGRQRTMIRSALAVTGLTAALGVAVLADDEAANTPYMAVDQYGRCYAKSVPAESYGSRGQTKIYQVATGQDRLIDTYAWYARQIYLECHTQMPDGQSATTVVQLGPWARGQQANNDELALAFHARGALVRRYSTLDIAGAPDRVSASVSHYTVISRVEGYLRVGNTAQSAFTLVTADGRRLGFDPATGARTAAPDQPR